MEHSQDPFEAVHGSAMPALPPISTSQTKLLQGQGSDPTSDAGGSNSRHSDTTQHASMLHEPLHPSPAAGAAMQPSLAESPASVSPTAATGAAAVAVAVVPAPAEVAAVPEPAAAAAAAAAVAEAAAPELQPLPPPDASEGPEAAAEYAAYLSRWRAGDTLAQRWHRLAASGLLSDIQADWEEWQLDMVLQQLRQSNASLAPPGKAAAAPAAGMAAGNGRARRGRGDVEDAADTGDEPRRVRSRRAPSTLQDYHVDTPGPGDRQEGAGLTPEPSALGSGQQGSRLGGGGTAAAAAAAADPSDDSGEEAAQPFLQQQQQRGPARGPRAAQQQQQRRGGAVQYRGAAQQYQQQLPPQMPPPGMRMGTQQQQQQLYHQQQQQHHHHHLQQQLMLQQQHAMQQHQHALQQQQQQQQQAAAAMAAGAIPQQVLEEAYKVGARLGAAFLQQQDSEGGSPGGAAAKPAAMAAFMQALCQYGANPAAMASIAALAQQQQR